MKGWKIYKINMDIIVGSHHACKAANMKK